jgi:hypothetical protein
MTYVDEIAAVSKRSSALWPFADLTPASRRE